jgi:nitrite reductase/ring-hydroxylating ferredoxin subunit
MIETTTQERFKRGAVDAGRFFHYIADFCGFTAEDAAAIRETRFIVEKYIPSIIADFYSKLLQFPATRRFFLRADGTIDQPYLELRMGHQVNFWRRAASGEYDDDFARFVDYVGRAHTSQGADPKIYIPERYVIGMVGFVQREVLLALNAELRSLDPELEHRAIKGWNTFMLVILEMLARAYQPARTEETFEPAEEINTQVMRELATDTYERALGIARTITEEEILVGRADEIPEGSRKIVQVKRLSIGVFHHDGEWIALQNSCLHRGGPVCEGTLEENTLTCPWHGYQYDVTNGTLLLDRSSALPRYPVIVRDGNLYLRVQSLVREHVEVSLDTLNLHTASSAHRVPETASRPLAENEFRPDQLPPGKVIQVQVHGEVVAVCNLAGKFYAVHDRCTHAGGPLSRGRLEGKNLICPWHDSCFDVETGAATCGPATRPVKTYRVILEGDIARVE